MAALRTALLAVVVLCCRWFLRRTRVDLRRLFVLAVLFVIAAAYLVGNFLPSRGEEIYRWIFFPQDMVVYVGVAALFSWWHFWKQERFERNAALPLLAVVFFAFWERGFCWG